ncbi:MAG: hypothetical protein HOC20_06310 [Chloroflexi bacterium]|jgi:hypothetical protein|nr:hypothetical protein [Chloroflexota bacterium]
MAWIPGEDLLMNGDLEWKGKLKADEPVNFSASIRLPREGEWRIYVQGDYPTNDRLPFPDSVGIAITDEGSYFGLE